MFINLRYTAYIPLTKTLKGQIQTVPWCFPNQFQIIISPNISSKDVSEAMPYSYMPYCSCCSIASNTK